MARKTDPPPTNEHADAADVPGPMPPPGVEARVKTTIDYTRRVDPDAFDNDERGATSIDDLAIEADADLGPPDPLAEFLETWGRYIGYNCEVVRLPDPADKRMIGNRYVRSNFGEIERLGGIPFDPMSLLPSIQMINGDSGGVFRLWLTDTAGNMIPGARLDRLAIADPPNSGAGRYGQNQQNRNADNPVNTGQAYGQPAPLQERSQSEIEKHMTRLQTRLLENALERALNPPPPTPQTVQLPDEDRLALLLLQKGDLLGNVVSRIVGLAQAPEAIATTTWKDKLVELAIQNPTLVDRVNTTIGNLADRLLGGAPTRSFQPRVDHQPTAYDEPASAAPGNMPLDAPQPEDEDEDEDMALLEDIVNLLSSNEPITIDNPVFAELRRQYPERFPHYVRLIAATPNVDILVGFLTTDAIAEHNPLIRTLLTGPFADYYRGRISELRDLCIKATAPHPAPTGASGGGGVATEATETDEPAQ